MGEALLILDKIHIRDLRLRGIIGIYPEERREKQDIIVNLTLHADLSKAGETDDIVDTFDYKNVKKRVAELVESSDFFLLERLAQRIAEVALEERLVERVDVTIDKPGALRFADSVAVEVSRARSS